MYIPRSNEETRPEVILEFIESHPFGSLVTAGDSGLFASHLPFVVDRSEGPLGTLQGHIARANSHHLLRPQPIESLVIFSGPNAYVTPSWYPAKLDDGKVVPTWNYVAVHVYGSVRFTEDSEYLRTHLETLTALHENRRAQPWSVSDAPPDYISQLVKGIVGVELRISRLEGKWKMSQNRSSADIDGVVEGLRQSQSQNERLVGEIVAERRPQ